MTRIDFYQLKAAQHSPDRVVCQLCQKAWENKQYTLLLTQDAQQTAHLDRQLWVFDDDSFVPHDAQETTEFKSPILIQSEAVAKGDRQLLINLNDSIPGYFAKFERVIELVTEQNRQQAREHYNFYRERGYPLNHHTL